MIVVKDNTAKREVKPTKYNSYGYSLRKNQGQSGIKYP